MSSLSEVQRLEFTVFGYIHRLERFSSSNQRYMSDAVKELIVAYAQNSFSWYTKEHGNGYRFFEDNSQQAEKFESTGFTFLASSNVLSLEICKTFEWEITIIDTIKDKSVNTALMIGFVAHPLENSMGWNTLPIANNHYSVHVYSGNPHWKKYGRDGNGIECAHQKEVYTINNGDRFCVRFDFEQSKCSFGYNDKFVADVYTNIPEKVIPVISFYFPTIFTCTKWNATFEDNSNTNNS